MLAAIRRNVSWWAIPVAGLIAGTVHLLITLIFMPLWMQIGPGLFLRYAGSLVLGPDALVGGGAGSMVVGVIVHYLLSLILTAIIALVVHRWGILVGLVGGAILGLAFYGINYYAITVFFPWFFASNNIVLLISHLAFGLTAGGIYEYFDTFDLPRSDRPGPDSRRRNRSMNEEQTT